MCTQMKAFFAAHLLNYTGGTEETAEEHVYINSVLCPKMGVKNFANDTTPVLVDQTMQKLVIIRDPIRRLLSAFASKCLGEFWVKII